MNDLNKHTQWVGMLIYEYVQLEHRLREYLFQLTGLSREDFEILVGHPRRADSVGKLKKLYCRKITDSAAVDAIDDALSQLKHISDLRDRVIHYGSHPVESGILVRRKPSHSPAFDIVDPQTLNNALIDLHYINRIMDHRFERLVDPINGVRIEPWRFRPL